VNSSTNRQRRAQAEIRRVRAEMRFDRYKFAALMNVSYQTIVYWETGRRNPLNNPLLLSIWWRGPIKAARIAERIIQVAFSEKKNDNKKY